MNITYFKNKILAVLKGDDRIWNKDKTELNQTLLLDLVEKIDEKIINLLLQEKDLREKFFVKIKDIYVFKTNDFRFFMEENKVDNSYTAYKNRIGLTDGKKFLKDTNDVVLDFPYKDCVLEGGQSTEEGTDAYFEYDEKAEQYEEKQGKRKEIFFNSVLAHDEIDRLFDAKALTSWKRFTKDGEREVKEIKRDEDGTIKENLIIKGNNLLALHSLKKQFAGKVKLIYIDPPYNTGNDGFKYNDNFNHSAWLTFMKNRLEVARELLRDDGVIFVQCDDNEQAYLKVLMDEVFDRENFVATAPRKTGAGSAATRSERELRKIHDFIQIYTKSEKGFFKKKFVGEKEFKEKDEFGLYSYGQFQVSGSAATRRERPNMYYPIFLLKDNILTTKKTEDYIVEILPKKINGEDGRWLWNKDKFEKDWKKYIVFDGDKIKRKIYKNEVEELNVFQVEKAYFENCTNKSGTMHINEINGKKNLFNNPKPEELLSQIIEMGTEKGDIVLDYHLGSGTTCAVAHKMGRQYIGIEQMDYIETITAERLKKVIDGEQGGISKSVNWQGGGDFIYFELAKWNETAKEKINNCVAKQELLGFFDELCEKYFLNYNLKIKEFREKVIREEKFKNLSLDEQKKMFVAMLDNNQMYVNKTEMADKKFAISEKDQKLTSEFYNTKN